MHTFQRFASSFSRLTLLASLSLLFSISLAPDVHAQAQIGFRNNTATAISNCLTGTRLATGPTFQVGLFAGPIGAPESALTQVAVTTCTQPGIFNGGDVALPGVAPGQAVLLQVRAWETAFGNTYQQAFCAPFSAATGRRALTGKSLLFQAVLTAIPGFPPPSLPSLGFRSFTVCIEPCLPVIQCPTNRVVECTNAAGNIVAFSVAASASCCSTSVTVTCLPASGSRFRLGTTPVTCTAVDLNARSSNACTFSVTVRDTLPPAIACPANIVVDCTNAAGNIVNFSATASDACDPNPVVTCNPPAGTLFPPGTNTVVCTALDDATNSARCTFTVAVRCSPPVITQQPTSLTVTQGATATFRTTATGSPPLRYQWRFNQIPISGATDNVLTIVNVGPNHVGDYDVVVFGAAGTVNSAIARLILVGLFSSDLYIKDTPADTGIEPNPDAGPMWLSQDIWVQNSANPLWTPYPFAGEPDASLTTHYNPEYRDPKASRPSYVYVRVRNRGSVASSASARLRVYWAKASTGLGWATQWTGSDGTGYLPDPASFGCVEEVLYGDEITKPRKNAGTASAAERDRYRDAIEKIGTDPGFVFSDGVSYFDKQDGVHGSPPSIAHHTPGFTPWHREFLNRYEVLLREADPRVSLLYWDWTTDPENSTGGFNFFTASFMGASGRGSGSPVAIGLPFSVLAPPSVTRRLSSSLTPSAASDATVLAEPDYEEMRSTLELSAHDGSHGYIGGGGNMSFVSSAAEDPIFYMLHTDADRLWAQWQRAAGSTARLDPATSYDPLSADAAITPVMAPWDGSSSITPWTLAGGYINAKTPKDASIVFPPIYDTAPLTIPVLQPGESVIFQIPWHPPNPADFACFGADQGHVCLLARIETSTSSPFGMTFAETGNLSDNVRNNNNIAWKNVDVVDDVPGLFRLSALITRNLYRSIVPTRFTFTIPPESQNDSFFRYGRILVDLGPELFKKWTDGGRLGVGVEAVGGNVIQIFGNAAAIDNLPLEPEEARVIKVRFQLNQNYPDPGSPAYLFDITQYGAPNRPDAVIGGQRYSVDIRKLVLVPARSDWRYFDQNIDLGTAWRQPNFDDSRWQRGEAELGFGDNPVTLINGGPATNRNITTYFRKVFQVDDPRIYRSLLLRLKRDDGAVVYLNGTEIHRSNLPASPIAFDVISTGTVAGAEEDAFIPINVTSALSRLVTGANTLAVEVHQSSRTSDDLSFDLELSANLLRPSFPPVLRLAGLNPARAYQIGTPIVLEALGFDPDDTISQVDLLLDGRPLQRRTSAPFGFSISNAPPGGHLLTLIATDSAGNTTTEAVRITVVSNLPPSVVVTRPLNRAEVEENQIAVLAATASDPGGAIAGVRFYLRRAHEFGAPEELVGTDLAEPYVTTTGPLKVGAYFVTAVARDNQGAEAQSLPVELIVSSPPVLSIARSGSDVTICWPPTAVVYRLEEATSLTRPIVWDQIPGLLPPDHNPGIGHCVVLKISPGPRFYRLARPEDP